MRVWWALAGLSWVVTSVAAALARGDGRTTSYVIGTVAGRLLGSLAIALLLRWAYVKLRGGGRPVRHPWTLVIAAVISLLTLGARTADAVACREIDPLKAADLLRDPPQGYAVEERSRDEARQLLDEFIEDARAEIREVTLAVAIKAGADEGVAVYALTSARRRLDPVGEVEDFRTTYEGDTETLEIAGEDAALASPEDGAVAFGVVGECGGVYLYGAEEAQVRDVARAIQAPEDD